ncbi:hypothetical protein O181_048978 [Austropuccinia psidii MF-1]|uniref:Uncharacterized protein n=1 Tax=Austropuccinia psidii MF-1 TaxID=1389203 RepID=A0A9Q3DZ01_9BASI|nr:hypothetical protein [Austropuccinia psidii MF-1]
MNRVLSTKALVCCLGSVSKDLLKMFFPKVGIFVLLLIGSYRVAAIRCNACGQYDLEERWLELQCSAKVKCMNDNCENMVLAGCMKTSRERCTVCKGNCGARQHFYTCSNQHRVRKQCQSCEEASTSQIPPHGSQ